MTASVPDPDALVVIASLLRPEEAGMLRGLLESAGIPAVVRDDALSSVHPFLQPVIGGAKLAVRAADAERAGEIVRSAGVLPGRAPDEPVEIPEEEWSRAAAPEGARDAGPGARSRDPWVRRGLLAVVAVLVWALLRFALGV